MREKNNDELKQLHSIEYVNAFEQHQSPRRLERLLRYVDLKYDYTVADFACGNGMLMEHVAPKVRSYIGIDFSEPFIQAADRKRKRLGIKNAEFLYSEIKDFCKRNPERFDVGFAMDFSEHVYDKDWLDILEAIRSSLKLDGVLYLHTPNAYFFIEIMKAHNFIFKQFPEHIAVRTLKHNINLLERAGFSEINFYLLPHYNILKCIHLFSYLPVVGKYLKARIFLIAQNSIPC